MIKRLLFAIAICLLLFSQAKADGLSVWGLGDYKTVAARIGYQFGSLEAGGMAGRIDDEEVKGFYGGYGAYHLPFVLDANDIPFLPIPVQTVSYLGYMGGIESEETDYGFHGPMFGLVLQKFIVDNPPLRQEEIQFVSEVQYLFLEDNVEDRIGKNEEIRVHLGLRIYFPKD